MKTEIAENYKRKVASRYLPIGPDQITNKVLESENYFVSQKYDGHLYLLYFDGKKSILKNHSGSEIKNLRLLDEFSKKVGISDELIFAGELYVSNDNKRTRSFDVTAALKSNPDSLKFAVFDILEIKGKKPDLDLKELHDKINKILPKSVDGVHVVNGIWVESRKEIETYFNELVNEQNSEGVVIKALDGPVYKVKPYITLDAVIIGYSEGDNSRSGMIKELLLGLMTSENEYRILTELGNGFSAEERKHWLAELKKEIVKSEYIEVSGDNLAFNMVKPKRVVELSCTDIISQNTKGQINKMTLKYDNNIGYTATAKKPMVSIFSPVFVKYREDKKANIEDAGMTQLTRLIELESDSNLGSKSNLALSKIIRREVYVKESKGNKMVRKFVAWKTNKEHSEEYPAYVLYFTDYSPSRADKLKTSIRVSNTEENILDYMKLEIEENIKRGWAKL